MILMGPSRPLFLYFRLFNTVKSKQCSIDFCKRLDSNRGPLVSDAIACNIFYICFANRSVGRSKVEVSPAGARSSTQTNAKELECQNNFA